MSCGRQSLRSCTGRQAMPALFQKTSCALCHSLSAATSAPTKRTERNAFMSRISDTPAVKSLSLEERAMLVCGESRVGSPAQTRLTGANAGPPPTPAAWHVEVQSRKPLPGILPSFLQALLCYCITLKSYLCTGSCRPQRCRWPWHSQEGPHDVLGKPGCRELHVPPRGVLQHQPPALLQCGDHRRRVEDAAEGVEDTA